MASKRSKKSQLSFTRLDRIDEVCDAFENAVKLGVQPAIDDYLGEFQGVDREVLLEELVEISGAPEYNTAAIDSIDTSQVPVQPSEEWPDLPGRYEVKMKIGCGGFGCVFLAHDSVRDENVAVKRPFPNIFKNLGNKEKQAFLREAAVSKVILRHRAIVPAYDFGLDNHGVPYIVFRYIDGKSLDLHLGWKLQGYRYWFEQMLRVCSALQHAHSKGVIHRDIKPKNMILHYREDDDDDEGRIFVTDFGLAKVRKEIQNHSSDKIIKGTLHYMSPEQLSVAGQEIDHRTDIYSLGVMLYQAITNQLPFDGEPEAVRLAIMQEDPTPPSSLTPAVDQNAETICLKAMAKDPRDRYQTMTELAHDIELYLRGRAIRGRRPQTIAGKQKAAKLSLTSFAASVCLLVAISVASLFSWFVAAGYDDRPLATLPAVEGQGDTRLVSIETSPPGAKVYFFPLDELGRPIESEMIRSSSYPRATNLKPGFYFVEAVWPDGSFHQVFRTVPGQDSTRGFHRHNRWAELSTTVNLPPVKIPRDLIRSSFVEIEGLLIACTEVTADQLEASASTGQLDKLPATSVSLNEAISYAERAGMRLPWFHELEMLSYTNTAGTRFPWGAVWPDDTTWKLKAVGEKGFDVFSIEGKTIYGLWSNAVEWTMTRYNHGKDSRNFGKPFYRLFGDFEAMAGWELPQGSSHDAPMRAKPLTLQPYIGFRYVRSKMPLSFNQLKDDEEE